MVTLGKIPEFENKKCPFLKGKVLLCGYTGWRDILHPTSLMNEKITGDNSLLGRKGISVVSVVRVLATHRYMIGISGMVDGYISP